MIATSNSAAGCKKNNGYVPISESCSNDSELEKLEEGLMTSDDIPSGSVSGDTDAVVRENRGSGSSGNSCNDSGAAGTAATEGKEQQRRAGSERARTSVCRTGSTMVTAVEVAARSKRV